jgi:hypothetical protein
MTNAGRSSKKYAATAMWSSPGGSLKSVDDCNVLASRYEINSGSAVIHTFHTKE